MLKISKKIIRWLEKYYLIPLIITIIIAIFIFYMSSKTFPPGIPGISYASYVYHLAVFFAFGFFLLISVVKGNYNKKYLILISILIAIAYGISDELHQFFIPGRYCCFQDVLINSVGILGAGVVYAGLSKLN
jgi:hypothetical protein